MSTQSPAPNPPHTGQERLDPHRYTLELYGSGVRGHPMQTVRARRLDDRWFHLIISAHQANNFVSIAEHCDRVIRDVVERQRVSVPEAVVRCWALWRDRLELFVGGPRKPRNRVVGQIKGALRRRCEGAPDDCRDPGVIWFDTFGIPLRTANQRMRCLRHLRNQMAEVGLASPIVSYPRPAGVNLVPVPDRPVSDPGV